MKSDAVTAASDDPAYDFPGDYWDGIEAALSLVPEGHPLRAYGFACFDHLKARVLARAEATDA
jgi:hypothetical protein